MVKVITASSCTLAWLRGVEWLLSNHGRWHNLVLDIEQPELMEPTDFTISDMVDAFLRLRGGTPVSSSAGTIFPAGPYLRHGSEGVFTRFLEIYDKAKRDGKGITWGTYAARMIRRRSEDGHLFNPLQLIVDRMRSQLKLNNPKSAAYELPLVDLSADLPISDGCENGRWAMGLPCLSHVSIKLIDRTHVGLTALYRNHYYVDKALGNLIGLAQLQAFLAKELELTVGALVCHSTYAQIDVNTHDPGWTLADVRRLWQACETIVPSRDCEQAEAGR